MPIGYRIDACRKIIWTTATGVLTDAELLEHKLRLTRDPEFQAGMRELSDVRNVERLDVTTEAVRRFVAQDAADVSRFREYRLAIVAPAQEIFGMARMYEMMTADYLPHVMVVRDMKEAMTWLGIEADL